MPKLIVTLQDGTQNTFDLFDDQITVGRLPDNTLQIDDASVSSHHATFTLADGDYVFRDIGSTNGSRVNGKTVSYYRSVAASYGLQAGVQSFGYVLMFMDDESLAYLDKSDGWEIGSGPSVVIVDKGAAKTLSSTTLRSGVYAFIFAQKGLMGGLGLQGSKITKITPSA